MNKTAFITGVLGQDGHYLKKILLKNNYEVIGFDRFNYIDSDIIYHQDDISDYKTVLNFVKKYKPSVIFNLAGVSDVFDPWNDISEITSSNILIPQNFIKAIRWQNPDTVFCQASSCLVFGKTKTKIQSESTIRNPIYPYGLSKNFIDGIIKEYREEKGFNFCSAILYNHDSPHRGEKFFIKKIISFAKQINKNTKKINFYNLNVKKDLGYAGDYMEALFLMSQEKKVDDYIISSGKLTNLMDIVRQVSFLSGHNLLDYIEINSDVKHSSVCLFGDNSKIQKKLGWSPKVSYENVVEKIWNNS